jgi:hypothetical protein
MPSTVTSTWPTFDIQFIQWMCKVELKIMEPIGIALVCLIPNLLTPFPILAILKGTEHSPMDTSKNPKVPLRMWNGWSVGPGGQDSWLKQALQLPSTPEIPFSSAVDNILQSTD